MFDMLYGPPIGPDPCSSNEETLHSMAVLSTIFQPNVANILSLRPAAKAILRYLCQTWSSQAMCVYLISNLLCILYSFFWKSLNNCYVSTRRRGFVLGRHHGQCLPGWLRSCGANTSPIDLFHLVLYRRYFVRRCSDAIVGGNSVFTLVWQCKYKVYLLVVLVHCTVPLEGTITRNSTLTVERQQ